MITVYFSLRNGAIQCVHWRREHGKLPFTRASDSLTCGSLLSGNALCLLRRELAYITVKFSGAGEQSPDE